jgi:ribonucleoside-diphosphate reductase alpha chain
MNRNASALSDNSDHFREYRDILLDMRFMPAGRIQAWAGSTKIVTPYNCYVSGEIHDSFIDGPKPYESRGSISIMDAAKQAAQTMRQGGGIGYDFSTLRPSGDLIAGVQSITEGPIAFMPIFDAICKATSSAGNRRGAQMGVLRVDHPDIEKFVHMKQNSNFLTGFNVSIAITDDFMASLRENRPFTLKFGGREYGAINPQGLWETIMRGTWDWAEPGVLFIDTINRMNNLWYCEKIAATNPCGEQPLPPYGACLLGSFNLAKYIQLDTYGNREFDFAKFVKDIPIVVRAMDNVVDKATYPLQEQRLEATNKRRMGIGVTGLANAIEALGMPYGSEGFLFMQAEILRVLRDEAYHASAMLAKEKGAFPYFDRDKYLGGDFIQTLSEPVQDAIYQNGIRNSHLLSIAPTGTISLSADNVSSGIEPVFSYSQERVINMPNPEVVQLEDYGVRVFGVQGKRAADVTLDEHLGVLLTAQQYVDSAVSKTCNVDDGCSWESFKQVYIKAWEGGAKGCTTFNKNGKRMGILRDKDDEETVPTVEACQFDPETGRKSCE